MKKPTYKELYAFLKDVDSSFPVPLSKKQDLELLAKKLLEKATLVSVWHYEEMVALVAGYTENVVDNMAYISVLATRQEARGHGYAKDVVQRFLQICRDKKLSAVHLYAVPTNLPAVYLYKSLGFVEYKIENEPRKEDLHLIYYIKKEN